MSATLVSPGRNSGQLVTVEPPVIGTLSLAQLVRDTWGMFDAAAMAQLAPLSNDPCYQMKFYKAPSSDQEVLAANGFAAYGMRITPGSIIFGFYLPVVVVPGSALSTWVPPAFTVQIKDASLDHEWYDTPVSSLFLANARPRYQASNNLNTGSFPNLLAAPYPVTGSGLFLVEIQETSGAQQRIELIFGVLEVCS
jgi:hypothetical protein